MGKRAKGRSLADFPSRSAAEQRILEAAVAGGLAKIGETRPDAASDSNTVRADFLRFLALGGDDEALVHETGLQVQGAWITGGLDLSFAEIAGGLVLTKCHFAETPELYDAQIRGLFSLEASRVPGLSADRLTCHSGVFLRNKFLATGEIRLLGATIGGILDCGGGRFENPEGKALSADGIKVGGSAFMRNGFQARGEIRLLGATIGGDLTCTGGSFENPKGKALGADGIKVGGFVSMGNGFVAQGEVRLHSATIGGNLDCLGGKFGNPKGPALNADGITVGGSVLLHVNFRAQGEVSLFGATISSHLVCTDGIFENPKRRAITADGIKVGGAVFMNRDINKNPALNNSFHAQGEVRLLGAAIGGGLDFTGGRFENQEGHALNADRVKVGGDVCLDDNFRARGEVRLLGATIGGNLDCSEGNFCNPNSYAIIGEGMRVSGTFLFKMVKITSGSVNLAFAHVARLADDRGSWPENIILDGFVYDRFAGDAPTTAKVRLAWLDKQRPEHSGKAKNPREFRPQPWLQLRKVLRDMGHLEDARQVAIAFENRKRFCRVIGEITAPAAPGDIVTRSYQWLQSRTARGFHFLYGALIRYGYRPAQPLWWTLVAVWAISSVLFDIGGHSRVFGPTDPQIFDKPAYSSCNPEKNPRANWTRCQTFPRAYPAFYPPLYALDMLLPVGKLGQQDHWAPLAPGRALTTKNRILTWAVQIAVWFDMMFGWIAGLLLIATVSGLAIRQDD